MKSYHKRGIAIVIFALIYPLALLSGCQNKPADANAQAAPPPPAVTVSLPVTKDVVHYAEFSGTTEAAESVVIRARVEGYLEKIHFEEGTRIRKGDLLFSIDDRPFQARLEEARAELAMRQAELRQAQATKIRKENALRDRAVSEVEVIDARAQLGKAEAGVTAAEAAVRTAQLNLSYTRIAAPISGRIGRSLVDEGNLVGAAERTQLTTIVKDDPVSVYFNISERDWVRFQAGRQTSDTAEKRSIFMGLSGRKDFPYEGRIDFVDNRVDETSGTLQVRGVFANPEHRILPGLFARVKIPMGKTQGALLVPDIALGRDQQGRFLLVANQDNISEYRPIVAGELVGDMRVIEKGLDGDERVIVNGIQKARPGAAITPMQEQSTESSAENPSNTSAAEPSV